MEPREFRKLLLQLEGEFGPKPSRNEKMLQAFTALQQQRQQKITKDEVLEHQIRLIDTDKAHLKTSLTQIIAENRQHRETDRRGRSRSSSGEDAKRTKTSSREHRRSSRDKGTVFAAKSADAEDSEESSVSGATSSEMDSDDDKLVDDWYVNHADLEFTKKLASGASGMVYKGIYKGQIVAIKVMFAETDEGEEAIQELVEEIKVMSLFEKSAPELVLFYGVCLEPAICIVMEYCGRGSLYEYLSNPSNSLNWSQLLDFAQQTTRGIQRLHGASPKIIHRDLKTKNILLTDDWQVKIADFGLARADTQTNQSMLGKICGTIGYCAPEIFYGTTCTTKSDIYSLGIVLWELITKCITGKYLKPYQEYEYINLELQILYQAAEMGLRPTLPQSCPDILADLVRRCWRAEAQERPNADEIQEILGKAQEQHRKDPQRWDSLRNPT